MAGLRLSVFSNGDLQAVIAGMIQLPRTVAKDIRTQTKRVVGSAFAEELAKAPSTRLTRASLISTATVAVRDSNVILQSGKKGALRRRGLRATAVEFGADREGTRSYETHSRKGTPYRVTRHTKRQLPVRNRKGNTIYPTASRVIPRLASLWVQTTLRAFHVLFENGLGPHG